MSDMECSTDSECCYQDDSGAKGLRRACFALIGALILCLLAHFWVFVYWKYFSNKKGPSLKIDLASLENDIQTTTAAGGDGEGIVMTGERVLGASGTMNGTREPQKIEVPLPQEKQEREEPQTPRNGSRGHGKVIPRSLGSSESVDADAQFAEKVVEVANLSLRSVRSARSLRKMDSYGSIRSLDLTELVPKMTVEPPSPASTAALDDIQRLRMLLDSERARRVSAENALGQFSAVSTPVSLCGTPGSRSRRKFPSSRTVERHALEACANATMWANSAASRASLKEKPGLVPLMVKRILVQLFKACRSEIKRRLDIRVAGLKLFLGTEAVQLGGTGVRGGMLFETHELLYGELRKRMPSVSAVGRQDLVALSARVLSRALGTEAQREAGRMLVHHTWPSFEPLVRSYLALFTECALQNPGFEFEETTGKEGVFDPEEHREIATFSDPTVLADREDGEKIAQLCCIVFPASLSAKTRVPPSDAAKSGVIIWSSPK